MTIAPLIAIGISAAASGFAASQQLAARADQNKANAQNQAMEQLQSQRNIQMALRQSRIQTANIFAMGANESGAGGGLQPSSGVAGAAGSFESQTNANITFAQQMNTLTQRRYGYLAAANQREGNAQFAQEGAQAVGTGLRAWSMYG